MNENMNRGVVKVPNNFADDPDRARRMGYQTKRGRTVRNELQDVLDELTPKSIIEQLKKDGWDVTQDNLEIPTNAKALAIILLGKALQGESWAAKLVTEQNSGHPMQTTWNKNETVNPANTSLVIEVIDDEPINIEEDHFDEMKKEDVEMQVDIDDETQV